MEQTLETLIAAAQAGDAEAFGHVVQRFWGVVRHVVGSVAPPQEVEDLVQDVFCFALRDLKTLRDPWAFRSWICRIASNRTNTWQAERLTEQEHRARVEEFDELHAPERAEHGFTPPVRAALDELTPEARAMLLLRYQEDKSHKQVGEAFGLSHEAACKRHAGLIRKLRKRLNPEDVL